MWQKVLKYFVSDVLTAEQSGDEQKTQDVYASKLDKVRESAASLTWRNIFGKTQHCALLFVMPKWCKAHCKMQLRQRTEIT